MKYAVMTFMYNGWANGEDGSHEELIQILADAKAGGIEAFCNTFMGNSELIKIYQKGMADTGLKMPVMDLIANLAVADKEQRKTVYDTMKQGIDICELFGTEIVHVAGCSLLDGTTPEDGRKLIAEGLMAFVADVEKRGMTLAFEDFDPSPTLICSAADCLDILNQCDERIKFVFDTGNFEASGEHAEDNFDKLIDRTCHFHFKDFQPADNPKGYTGAHFGQGFVKNQQVADMIKQVDYTGWIALESYLQNGSGAKETVKTELDLLKAMF